MAPTAQKLLPSQDDSKKKEMKRKKKEREGEESVEQNNKLGQEKNKMGQEIEEIFRANKKKVKESPATTRAKENDKMKKGKDGKEKKEEKKKNKKCPVDESSKSCEKRRRTADGFTIYSAEELRIGNPDAGSTPLCPFDCSCCF